MQAQALCQAVWVLGGLLLGTGSAALVVYFLVVIDRDQQDQQEEKEGKLRP